MAKPYFSYIPNFEYVSRLTKSKNISDYIEVKNLFKRAKLRSDVLQDLTNFTKYKVVGEERPDNVAFKIYGDQYLDWLVLLSNNIVNVEDEWPLNQDAFDKHLINKYRTTEKIYAVHHYESQEVKDTAGRLIIPKGYEVPQTYSVTYYDTGTGTEKVSTSITDSISNYTYETRKEDKKRNIYLLKTDYVALVISDLESMMPYRKGSTQYVSDNIVRGENIRLYN